MNEIFLRQFSRKQKIENLKIEFRNKVHSKCCASHNIGLCKCSKSRESVNDETEQIAVGSLILQLCGKDEIQMNRR